MKKPPAPPPATHAALEAVVTRAAARRAPGMGAGALAKGLADAGFFNPRDFAGIFCEEEKTL